MLGDLGDRPEDLANGRARQIRRERLPASNAESAVVAFLDGQLGASADRLHHKGKRRPPVALQTRFRMSAGRDQGPAQREHWRPAPADNVAGLRGVVADQGGR